jgi:hypothetical protein
MLLYILPIVAVVLTVLKVTGYIKLDWRIYASILTVFVLYGSYEYGKKVMYDSMQVEIAQLKAKAEMAAAQSEQANTKIDGSTKEIVKKIETKTNTVIQYIDREVTKYDNSCVIPKEVITAHNEAAKESK